MFAPDEFHSACLGALPLRLEIGRPGGGGVAVEIACPAVVVGAGPGVDVDLAGLTEAATPARLIYFQLLAGHLFAVPLARAAAVTVNGQPLTPRWVRPGDEFAVAGAAVRPLNPAQRGEAPPDWHPTKRRGEAAIYHLECLFPTQGPRMIPCLRALWLVGDRRPPKSQSPATNLAPIHAAFVATPGGVWAVNLASAGGLTVDGVVVLFAKLRPGAVVGLATRRFRYCPPESAARYELARVEPAEPAPASVSPREAAILEHVAQLQQQTFEQFQQVLGSVVQMVGAVLADQRQLMKDELDRMERLIGSRAPAHPASPALPPAALPALPPAALPGVPAPAASPALPAVPATAAPGGAPRAPAADAALHSWVQTQLRGLERSQKSLWQRLKDQLAGGGS